MSDLSENSLPEPTRVPPPDPSPNAATSRPAAPGAPKLVLFIASDRLGDGPEELGRVLMRAFFKTCRDLPAPIWRAVFLNSGIALTTKGSPLLEDLKGMEERGTEILSCGTCLDYFRVKDALEAGRVSNMAEIVETLATADRVIRP